MAQAGFGYFGRIRHRDLITYYRGKASIELSTVDGETLTDED